MGMGHDLYESAEAARAVFDQADEKLGFSLSKLCFEGPEDALTDTVNQQPSLFTVSLAIWRTMMARNWSPPDYAAGSQAYVAGHSLGEFSALTAAGSLTFADGLALVRRRGELMKQAGEQQPGAMAAVLGLDVPTMAEICAEAREQIERPVQVANDNCPGQVVVSGDSEALVAAMRLAEEAGARRVVRLPISIAAHSPLMAPAAEEFAAAVDETSFAAPKIPVIGNVTGRPLTDPDSIRAELKAQLTSPVAWTSSMEYLLNQGVDTVVEVGPGQVLLNLMKRIDRSAKRIKPDLEA